MLKFNSWIQSADCMKSICSWCHLLLSFCFDIISVVKCVMFAFNTAPQVTDSSPVQLRGLFQQAGGVKTLFHNPKNRKLWVFYSSKRELTWTLGQLPWELTPDLLMSFATALYFSKICAHIDYWQKAKNSGSTGVKYENPSSLGCCGDSVNQSSIDGLFLFLMHVKILRDWWLNQLSSAALEMKTQSFPS